jgi:pantoate--beta-alanine ligase
MTRDLTVPVSIVPVVTVRESDGLAMSSRNQRLTPDERRMAVVLSQALFAARDLIQGGERSVTEIRAAVEPVLGGVEVEYFSVVDPETLAPVERIEGPVLVAGAIWVGKTRLIDNLKIDL